MSRQPFLRARNNQFNNALRRTTSAASKIDTPRQLNKYILDTPKALDELIGFVIYSRAFSWAATPDCHDRLCAHLQNIFAKNIIAKLSTLKITDELKTTYLPHLMKELIKDSSYNDIWTIRTLANLLRAEKNKTFLFQDVETYLRNSLKYLNNTSQVENTPDQKKIIQFFSSFYYDNRELDYDETNREEKIPVFTSMRVFVERPITKSFYTAFLCFVSILLFLTKIIKIHTSFPNEDVGLLATVIGSFISVLFIAGNAFNPPICPQNLSSESKDDLLGEIRNTMTLLVSPLVIPETKAKLDPDKKNQSRKVIQAHQSAPEAQADDPPRSDSNPIPSLTDMLDQDSEKKIKRKTKSDQPSLFASISSPPEKRRIIWNTRQYGPLSIILHRPHEVIYQLSSADNGIKLACQYHFIYFMKEFLISVAKDERLVTAFQRTAKTGEVVNYRNRSGFVRIDSDTYKIKIVSKGLHNESQYRIFCQRLTEKDLLDNPPKTEDDKHTYELFVTNSIKHTHS